MLVDQDLATGKRDAQRRLLQLPNVVRELDGIVFSNGSFVLDREHTVQIMMLDGHERGPRFGRSHREFAVEFNNLGLAEKLVGLLDRLDPTQPQFLR